MKALVGVLLAALSCLSCAASAKHAIDISRPNTAYERGEPVRLVLKNVGPAELRVYSNLEVVDEKGKWVSWPFRIEDGRVGAISTIYRLLPGKSITLAFDVRKITLPPVPPGQQPKMAKQLKFRFRVVALQAKGDTKVEELFSEPFVVMHPYKH
jgi:hypothetical protein